MALREQALASREKGNREAAKSEKQDAKLKLKCTVVSPSKILVFVSFLALFALLRFRGCIWLCDPARDCVRCLTPAKKTCENWSTAFCSGQRCSQF
jgi:hypothetical protein